MDELLQELNKIGVTGATVLDSIGMGKSLGDNSGNNVFSGIRSIYNYSYPRSKTIFSVIDKTEILDKAIEKTEEVTGGFFKTGKGILFTLPVDKIKG